jgi:hypothetical protein
VKDLLGLEVHCTGKWNSPGDADKTRSAVKVLHDLSENLRCPYFAARAECIKCTEEYKDPSKLRSHSACDTYAGRPCLSPHWNIVMEQCTPRRIGSCSIQYYYDEHY